MMAPSRARGGVWVRATGEMDKEDRGRREFALRGVVASTVDSVHARSAGRIAVAGTS